MIKILEMESSKGWGGQEKRTVRSFRSRQKGRVKQTKVFHTPFFYLFIPILHPRSVYSRLPQLLQAGHTFHSEDVRHVLLPNGK